MQERPRFILISSQNVYFGHLLEAVALLMSNHNLCFHEENMLCKSSEAPLFSVLNPCPAEPGYTLPLQTM